MRQHVHVPSPSKAPDVKPLGFGKPLIWYPIQLAKSIQSINCVCSTRWTHLSHEHNALPVFLVSMGVSRQQYHEIVSIALLVEHYLSVSTDFTLHPTWK